MYVITCLVKSQKKRGKKKTSATSKSHIDTIRIMLFGNVCDVISCIKDMSREMANVRCYLPVWKKCCEFSIKPYVLPRQEPVVESHTNVCSCFVCLCGSLVCLSVVGVVKRSVDFVFTVPLTGGYTLLFVHSCWTEVRLDATVTHCRLLRYNRAERARSSWLACYF